MPVLSCAATTCIYNKDELCSRGEIKVAGDDARHPDDTCCASFVERSDSMRATARTRAADVQPSISAVRQHVNVHLMTMKNVQQEKSESKVPTPVPVKRQSAEAFAVKNC